MIPYCISVIEDDSDRAFMTDLYLNYRKLMYSEIQKVAKNEWDTEDILQSVLEKLIDKIPTLRGLSRNKRVNYIISACKYTAFNYIRDSKAHKETPFDDYADIPDPNHSRHEIELRIIKEEELSSLAQIWQDLDLRTQCLLEGYYILEKPMSELAKDLGISPASVRMALTRARKKAFELLSKNLQIGTKEGTH